MSESPNDLPNTFWPLCFGHWNLGHYLVFGIWDLVLLGLVQINPQLIKNQGQKVYPQSIRILNPLVFSRLNSILFENLKFEIEWPFVIDLAGTCPVPVALCAGSRGTILK
jgi:hypothetical protein